MATALFRRGTGLCVRCIHRELCRLVWRPQTALFSSKVSDRKQPRRTHIKKAKPQPALDVSKLLEQLFSQRRPGTTPPTVKARPAKVASSPLSPFSATSVEAPRVAAVKDPAEAKVAAPAINQPLTMNRDSGVVNVSHTTKEVPSVETVSELPAEANQIPAETLETRTVTAEDAVEPNETKTMDSGIDDISHAEMVKPLFDPAAVVSSAQESAPLNLSHTAKSEPLVETTDTATVASTAPLEILEKAAGDPEGLVETTTEDVAACQGVQGPLSFSHPEEEPLIETTIETVQQSIEVGASPLEALEKGANTAEGLLETTIESGADTATQDVQTSGTEPGPLNTMNTSEERLMETTLEQSVEGSTSPLETQKDVAVAEGFAETTIKTEADVVPQGVQTSSGETSPLNTLQTAEEPFIETTKDTLGKTIEASTAPQETLEKADVAKVLAASSTETVADTASQDLQTDIAEAPLIETVIEPSLETRSSSLKTQESNTDAVDFPVEPLVNAASQPGPLVPSVEEPLQVDTRIEPSVEAGTSPLQENTFAHSEDLAVFSATYSPEETPKDTATEPITEVRTSLDISDSTVESTLQAEPENLSNMQEPEPFTVNKAVESTPEPALELVTEEVEANKPEQMTLESVTLHGVQVQVESLESEELQQINALLERKAEEEVQKILVQAETGAEGSVAAETVSEDEGGNISQVLSKWESLSEDLQEFEGQSGTLVKEMFFHAPAAGSKTSDLALDQPVVSNIEEKVPEAEAMTLESVTLANVEAEIGGLETEVLEEVRYELEKEAEVLYKEEKMEVMMTKEENEEDSVFDSTTEAEVLSYDSIAEATDAIEAETSVIMEAIFGSEQGPRQPVDTVVIVQDEPISQAEEKESQTLEVNVVEAMTLESVTLAEVEASLGALEDESLSETSNHLEKEAEAIAVETKMETEVVKEPEETTVALSIESLSLPEDEALPEALQVDALMEELLFSVPGPTKVLTKGQTNQEVKNEDVTDAMVATGSVNIDATTPVGDDFSASQTPEDDIKGEEMKKEEGAQTEALENIDVAGTQTNLDPVQKLFLEKIREFSNMQRLNGGLLDSEQDYEKKISEETAKLQRLFGGGDLTSFPEFTFTEPKLDQDS